MRELTNGKRQFFDIIEKLVNFNKISHAYLIEVSDMDADMVYILNFVKMILCSKSNKKLDSVDCGECNICKFVNEYNYLDLKIIEPDGNFIKKNQLLQLQEEYHNKSLLGNKRIYIIKDAQKLNGASANTILKFLEEPEDDIIAILLTTNRFQMLDTILSRCQVLSLQDNDGLIDVSDDVLDILKCIVSKKDLFIKYKNIFNAILPDKIQAKDKFVELEEIFIEYLNYLSDTSKNCCDGRVIAILANVDIATITNYISIFEEELRKLEYNVNYKLWLDSLFAKLIGG